MKTINKLWIVVIILVIISPLGLILPEFFKSGAAWGEWGPDEIRSLIGYIPTGLARLSSLWTSPIPDYDFKGWEGKPAPYLSVAYIISAVVGIAVTAGVILLAGKFLTRNR